MKKFLNFFFKSYIWLMVLVFLIDIISKWSVLSYFKSQYSLNDIANGICVVRSNTIPVLPGFLHVGCTLNKGAAWSLGTTEKYDGVNPVLIVISVVLTTALIIYYIKEFKKLNTLTKVGLSLMISGAFGNMIDRIFYRESITGFKGVIDWIYVAFMNFPTFNIADSALVIGVIVLIICFIIEGFKDISEKSRNGEYKYSPKELKEMKDNERNQNK